MHTYNNYIQVAHVASSINMATKDTTTVGPHMDSGYVWSYPSSSPHVRWLRLCVVISSSPRIHSVAARPDYHCLAPLPRIGNHSNRGCCHCYTPTLPRA